MKIIFANTATIAFLLIAAYMIYNDAYGYGYVIFLAAILSFVPKNIKS